MQLFKCTLKNYKNRQILSRYKVAVFFVLCNLVEVFMRKLYETIRENVVRKASSAVTKLIMWITSQASYVLLSLTMRYTCNVMFIKSKFNDCGHLKIWTFFFNVCSEVKSPNINIFWTRKGDYWKFFHSLLEK